MTAYEQGFMSKCAEYGVDPEWLVAFMEKDAFQISPALKQLLAQIPKAGRSALVAQARQMPHRNHGELMKNITGLLEKQIGAVKQVGVNRFPAAVGTDFQKMYTAMSPGQRGAALSNIRQGIFGTDTGKLVDYLNQVGLGSYGKGVNMRARRDMAGYITDAMSKGKSGRLNPQALKWRASGVSNRLSSRLGNAGGDALASREGLSQTELKDLLKAKYGNRVPPRAKVVAKDAVQPRKGGLPPYNPQEAATRGINVSPYGTVTGYGGDIPLFSMYGDTAGAAAAQGLPAAAPVASSAGGGLRWPWLSNKWGRMVELLGGGNANARAISEGRRRARVLEDWLANGTRSVEAGSAGHARLAPRASKRLGQTNADIARRLQNGGREELNKVLAARLGVGGAGALGIAGTGAALSSGDNYTQQVPEPWQTWGNV